MNLGDIMRKEKSRRILKKKQIFCHIIYIIITTQISRSPDYYKLRWRKPRWTLSEVKAKTDPVIFIGISVFSVTTKLKCFRRCTTNSFTSKRANLEAETKFLIFNVEIQ